jgi:hypothetical protein
VPLRLWQGRRCEGAFRAYRAVEARCAGRDGGHDADIRYIAEAIGVGRLCYVIILLDPTGSEAHKDGLGLGNQHRTAVRGTLFDPCQVSISDLLTWQPASMKTALVVLQFDYSSA